jgi:hypothetical protein
LQDNGGPTFTQALLPGSPAIDAGDNTAAPPFDQRGFTRIDHGTIDIGAYELQQAGTVSTTTTLTSSANPSVYRYAVTFTASVAAVSPGAGTPSGTATFKDGSSITGRQHARLQQHGGFHHLVAVQRQLLDHRQLRKGHPLTGRVPGRS